MNDVIRDSLAHRADELDVPPVDAAQVLGMGKRARRGRQAGVVGGTAAAAVVAVAGTLFGVSVLTAADPGDSTGAAGGADSSEQLFQQVGPYILFEELHVGEAVVDIGQEPSGLYTTATGAVYKIDTADGAALYAVDPTGERISLGTTGRTTIVGTDPDSSLVAWSEQTGDGTFTTHVADATTGDDVGSVTYDGDPWQAFDTPRTALDGTTAYVHLEQGWMAWDASGESDSLTDVPGTSVDVYEVMNGVYVVNAPDELVVNRLADGGEVGRVDIAANEYGLLSDDGAYLKIFDQDTGDARIVRISTSQSQDLPGGFDDERAWAPSGDLVVVENGNVIERGTAVTVGPDGQGGQQPATQPTPTVQEPAQRTLKVCDPDTLSCTVIDGDFGNDELYLARQPTS